MHYRISTGLERKAAKPVSFSILIQLRELRQLQRHAADHGPQQQQQQQ
jgi:hypothetical protein